MYAILDIETTGGKYDEEGITEIAIYKYDGQKITDQFSSLINPQKEIQPFVEKLTGINSKMLRNAPKFFEVAKRIIEITENCIIVAHNASFDYRILQTEYRRLGFPFERKSICTVELAKKLLPDQPAYSLGKLVRNLGIPFSDQHRAYGDAKVTLKLFEILLEKDVKKEILMEHIKIINLNKVPLKYLTIVDKLPSEMGVYYLYNSKNDIIYIGKSNNIKKRVLSHLTGTQRKAISIQNEITRITYSLTGGELVTLLKEQNEIKNIGPKLNHSVKYRLFPFGIRLDTSYDYPNFIIEQIKNNTTYISVFINQKAAKKALFKWAEDFRICLQKTSLFSSENICLNYEIQKCDGACVNEESLEDYQLKIMAVLEELSYPHENFLLIDKGKKEGEFSFVYIENSVFKGYGYHELNHQIKSRRQIQSRLISMDNNPDTQKLIHSFLRRKKFKKLIPLAN
jgi:DNA polymerase-3 subunit epsilon|tara:strand:- start:1447 stop:2811 length:1365 start_codon:yes stop_codon:yes gene_type:complete